MINSFKNMHVLALSSYKQNVWAPDVHAIHIATCNLWSQHSTCTTLQQQHAQQPKFPTYIVPHNTAGWAWTCTACQTLMHNSCIFWTMQCTKIVSTNLGTKLFDSPSDHKKQDSFKQYFARKTCILWPGRHQYIMLSTGSVHSNTTKHRLRTLNKGLRLQNNSYNKFKVTKHV